MKGINKAMNNMKNIYNFLILFLNIIKQRNIKNI